MSFTKKLIPLKQHCFTLFLVLILVSCGDSNSSQEKKVKDPSTKKQDIQIKAAINDTIKDSFPKTKKYIPPVKPIYIIPIEPGPPYFRGIDPPYDPEPPIELPKRELTKDSIVEFPDIAAEFPGGSQALSTFVRKNLVFPELCRENNIEGKVFVKFLVHSTGEISQIHIVKSIHPMLDLEAKNLVRKMPLWNPAVFQVRKVPSYAIIPIVFKIE
ncbi:MAG: energy transducer TonB [Bacteroidota bacterium]